MKQMFRETWAEVDLSAIRHNIKQIKNKLQKDTEVTAVVKADGYGHGAVQVAKAALQAGATRLAVALLEEAMTLREAGITAPVIVLSAVSPSCAKVAADNDIELTFYHAEWVEAVALEELSSPLKLHMKWDTGMGRAGIRTKKELKALLRSLLNKKCVKLVGIYTHFATADEEDITYFNKQSERFKALLDSFKEDWTDQVSIHVGNSAAAIRHPDEMLDFVRFGVSTYGLYPSSYIKGNDFIDLKQAFSLHSKLIHVKEVEKGEAIGYGSTYIASKREWIGTIPLGYGDGWSRQLQGIDVLVGGEKSPIIGRICMDQLMIRLTKPHKIGTKVTLIGEQEGSFIDMDEIAEYLGTINYEIPCMLKERIPRIYLNEHEND